MAQDQPATLPQSQSVLVGFLSRLRDIAGGLFKERKPWAELVDRSAFSRPENLAEATNRLRKNANYFKINYLIIVLLTTAVCMLLNPSSLIVVAVLAVAWMYLFVVRQAPIVIGGRTFSDREKFIGMSVVSIIVIFFLTSVGTILFTALGISVAVIAAHGSLRQPDDLFSDQDEGNMGILSFLNMPKSGAVASAV